eukprot:6412790-Amphidinium_carterae.2
MGVDDALKTESKSYLIHVWFSAFKRRLFQMLLLWERNEYLELLCGHSRDIVAAWQCTVALHEGHEGFSKNMGRVACTAALHAHAEEMFGEKVLTAMVRDYFRHVVQRAPCSPRRLASCTCFESAVNGHLLTWASRGRATSYGRQQRRTNSALSHAADALFEDESFGRPQGHRIVRALTHRSEWPWHELYDIRGEVGL